MLMPTERQMIWGRDLFGPICKGPKHPLNTKKNGTGYSVLQKSKCWKNYKWNLDRMEITIFACFEISEDSHSPIQHGYSKICSYCSTSQKRSCRKGTKLNECLVLLLIVPFAIKT
ncbi:hypothetical protein CEXT_313221 [Caerostris extrusa]|uniref:Uncharacterized protein n=1 Tax=Caerostris extrusa TaxID=172846 RepID=A0AAV4QFV1_CAEEX|nr:hypothetical protein CEXT_313221 [Caerostris extrusa]